MRRNSNSPASRTKGDKTGRSGARRLLASAAAAFAVAAVMLPASAQAWWNQEWSLRKKITFDASSTGSGITDPIGNVPVLVRLHAGNFRFNGAKEDGSDLRFVAGDDKTPLKFHVEKYDALLGEALIWVNVPNMQPGAKTDVWAYYGNKKATSASDPKGTYGSETALVYHFSERGTPAQDATVWSNSAQNAGQAADGSLIGTGLRLDGVTPITLPAAQSLTFAHDGQLTWSAWIKPSSLQRNAVIYSRRENGSAFLIGIDDGAPFVEISNGGAVQRSASGAPVAPGGWHHIAVVATPGLVTIYLDGNAYGSLTATLPPLNSIAQIGGDAAMASAATAGVPQPPVTPTGGSETAAAQDAPSLAAAPPSDPAAGTPADLSQAAAAAPPPVASAASAMPGFAGDMDELEIAKIARPAGYIKAIAINQGTDPSKFTVFSVDEETSSWLSGYFGVLIQSVTFDGWVVIGILLIMGVTSWVVMVEKNSHLSRQKKGNTRFIGQFRLLQDDLTALLGNGQGDAAGKEDAAMRRNSSLNRLYQIGAQEIRKRFPVGASSHRPHVLTAESIASIRAALDGGLVREIQQLNRLMVILTISISGGPFLGLLGTVIGVMITFAAIAMSGDVNINAIAPGVAGALMATVAGLVVAIPALFGYNYLTLRIKDLTADMQVFVDEFTTKIAEVYSADQPQHRLAAE